MLEVPKVRGRSRAEIEAIAERVVKAIEADRLVKPKPADVVELFEWLHEDKGFDTAVADLGAGIEGMTWPGRVTLSEITYRGICTGDPRSRFTAVHEAGHALMHMNELQTCLVEAGSLSLFRRADIRPFEDPEWQADQFAGAYLMPAKMVLRSVEHRLRSSWPTVIAGIFEVSPAAAEVRVNVLKKMGVLS